MEYHIHFDPMGNSLLTMAAVTVLVAFAGLVGLVIVRGMKSAGDRDEESITVVKGLYIVVYGILLFTMTMATSCQTTGCTDSGNFKLLSQQNYNEQLKAENDLLRAKMRVLELNGVDPDSYDIPLSMLKDKGGE